MLIEINHYQFQLLIEEIEEMKMKIQVMKLFDVVDLNMKSILENLFDEEKL